MKTNSVKVLWSAFYAFYQFAPARQTIVLFLMLAQGLSAGVGLLFILPLLQIVGIDMGGTYQGVAATATWFFETFDLKLKLPHLLVIYVVIVAIIASSRFFLAINTTILRQRYVNYLRNDMYRQLLHSSWPFIVNNKISDFIHCLAGQVQAIGLASYLMLNLLSQVILSLIMAGLAFLLSWQISLIAIGFAFVLFCLLLPLNRVILGSGQHQLLNFKAVFQILTEQLSSLKMIKSYASEAYHADKLAEVSDLLEVQQVRLTKMNAITQWVYIVGAAISFSGFFYISQVLLDVTLPTILLLLIICSRLLPQLMNIHKTYQQLLHQVPAFEDVHKMKKEFAKVQEAPVGKASIPMLEREIKLANVTFGYPGKDSPVFCDFSLEIPKNQTIALVGPSGAGKSTLADLIAGLLAPEQGGVYCDDQLLDNEYRLAWRSRVAYVTQEVYLLHDTVRANLTWVRPGIGEEILWQVLKMAAADTFVANLPQGLDTVVGDKGVRLSGGERQRLALARALLAQPQLLILDEATSAVDSDNEQKIIEAIKSLRGKLTIIIIAHRKSTLAHVDRCVNLEECCERAGEQMLRESV